MQNVKPLKRLGQNYLHDKNIIRKIIAQINPQQDDALVEIGPGRGALTEYMHDKTKNYFAIEIDNRVIEDLRNKFPDVKLVQEDFLKTDLSKISQYVKSKIRLIGNIPYNLTSSIIFKAIRNSKIITDCTLMVQDEVAHRMTAQKNTKDYGILTVLLTYFTDTKYCFKVSPNAFYPKPNVWSAIVQIKMNELRISDSERETFINVVKAAFGNRRKTLKNSLSNSIFRELNFSQSGIDLSLRAEQLDLEDFINLAAFVKNNIE